MRRRTLALAVGGALAALPAPAGATFTIGSTLPGPPDVAPACGTATCTEVQTARVGSAIVASPVDGVVTGWNVHTAGAVSSLTFHVVQRTESLFRVVGSDTRTIAGAGQSEFETRIPIARGELLGLSAPAGTALLRNTGGGAGDEVRRFSPALGATDMAATATSTSVELLVQAFVEPDADGDGFGDETQDECPDDPAGAAPCSGTRVGPPVTGAFTWDSSLSSGSAATATSPGSASPPVVPADGVLVRWRVRSNSGGGSLQVLRPAPALPTAQVVARGPDVSLDQPATEFGTISVRATRLPVRAGDVLGLRLTAGSSVELRSGPGPLVLFIPPAELGGPPRTAISTPGYDLPLNGDVEPDADGDGFGDVTQDGCASDAARQGACAAPSTPPQPTTVIQQLVQPPAVITGLGTARIASSSLRWNGGGALAVPLRCPAAGGRCAGTLRITARVGRRTVTVGSARFALAPGQARTLTLRVPARTRRALGKRRRTALRAQLTPTEARQTVTLVRSGR